MFGGDGSTQRFYREAAAECERVEAVIARARIESGLEAADAAQGQASDRLSELEAAIAARPARTLAGAGVKARLLVSNRDSVPDEELVQSLAEFVTALSSREGA